MIPDLTVELRDRLDLAPDVATDAQLDHVITVAEVALTPWLAVVEESPYPYRDNVDEAVVQLAVKLWDAGNRGVVDTSTTGDWTIPAPAATPGLIRSVFGALGPALAAGGVSV